MKQFLRNGKKALSVFMAVLMAMTASVLFSPESAKIFAEERVTEHNVHIYDPWCYKENPADVNSFVKEKKCKFCEHTETEKAADGITDNVYYTVTYKNEWVTASYDETVKNDELAKTYKTEQVAFEYVLSGTAAAYKGIPTREKDKAFGKYNFTGWTVDEGSLSAVTTNIVASATFAGEKVDHYISFFDADGKRLTKQQTVAHGGEIQKPYDPTLTDVGFFKRTFTGWDYDYTHIYKDGGIYPEFDLEPKQFTLVYIDWDKKELGREEVPYEGSAKNNPNPVRSDTNEFIYSFSGNWYTEDEMTKLENGEEATPINLNKLILPYKYSDAPEGTEIYVYAKYDQRLKRYPLDLTVKYSDGYPAENCAIQVQGADGSLLATGNTGKDGKAYLELIYSTEYTISVTDNLGSAKQEKFTIAFTTGPYNISLRDAREYHVNNAERCTCICHSFLGGIHIWFLNLLYSIFQIKYVCCYDMYATHGSELKYTQ